MSSFNRLLRWRQSATITRVLRCTVPKVEFSTLDVNKLRNVGVIAHIDAGKTTTTERMLRLSGAVTREGRVDNGDTITDFLAMERERGITIQSAAVNFDWRDHHICLVDTPGHVDFTVEVERSLRVLDGAVLILDAVAGVQAQTETVWRQASRNNLPAICMVNKMDRAGADFEKAVETLKGRLGITPIPLQMPLMKSDECQGALDLMSLKTESWTDASVPVPENAKELQLSFLESLADLDDDFCEVLLDSDGAPSTQQIVSTVRRLTLSGRIVPVVLGASLRGHGVERVLDSIAAFLPGPLEVPSQTLFDGDGSSKTFPQTDASPLTAFAFKIVHDRQRGPLVYLRVFSGVLSSKQKLSVMNSSLIKPFDDRPLHLYAPFADDFQSIEEARAGSTVVAVGLKKTKTGDTLTSDSRLKGKFLKGITIPEPVFSLTVEPQSTAQNDEFETALNILSRDDPSLRVTKDEDSGETLLSGLGELHLEVATSRLQSDFNVPIFTGSMRIAYREGVSEPTGMDDFLFDHELPDGKRLYAGLSVAVTPTTDLSRCPMDPPNIKIAPALLASKKTDLTTFEAIKASLAAAFSRGPAQGHPVVGVDVEVHDIQVGPDSSHGAFRAAVNSLVRKMFLKSPTVLLEPIMRLEIVVADEHVGAVLSDLSSRKGQIEEVVSQGDDLARPQKLVQVTVPVANVLGYSTSLRSLTSGEGVFSMEYSHHAPAN